MDGDLAMRGGTVVRQLMLVAILALALEHGLAGAATHLPKHPDHALLAMPAPLPAPQPHAHTRPQPQPHECGTEPREDRHDGTSCEIVASGGPFHQPALAAGAADSTGDSCPVLMRRGCPTSSRSPPSPSLAALSVLRV
ncbi:hypothetical protein U9R90_27970 [Streptomyces sp. E11-3]|uniref:hypothetical protein n=1 Tax=Streptomyces sp. E11-3 TaxID=3110112 RepID=UPI0039807193